MCNYIFDKMDIKLRIEQPSDYNETENVTREAFWNHFSPGCDEHYLLHIMRNNPKFVPELDIVAELNGKIVGNVVCLKSFIMADDGNQYEVLSLGPISVLPEYQQKGIGGKMIALTKERAFDMGFRAILLCGDPDYYLRQRFILCDDMPSFFFIINIHKCFFNDTSSINKIRICYFKTKIQLSVSKFYSKHMPFPILHRLLHRELFHPKKILKYHIF